MNRYIISSKHSDIVDQKDLDAIRILGEITYVGDCSFGVLVDVQKEEELRNYCREHELWMARDGALRLQ